MKSPRENQQIKLFSQSQIMAKKPTSFISKEIRLFYAINNNKILLAPIWPNFNSTNIRQGFCSVKVVFHSSNVISHAICKHGCVSTEHVC